MNVKATAILGLLALTLVAVTAAADEPFQPHPGTKGTVTAYEADSRTVIQVRACPYTRYSGHDYMQCGDALRGEVRALLCARGRGAHDWVYQVSDGAHIPSMVFCH